ncbi:MAG: type I methionyl aminopeptidase [Oscillospiraceae bacterium]|jgi:methionyl aminopeptidase|nr:type I methionyl aminopeptidase [Oscillospiraceae bacterium]
MIIVKNSSELQKIRKSCELSARTLRLAGEKITAGISTWELDRIIREYIERHGGRPSFLRYRGFRGSACISVNHELIHGIPSKKKILKDGDIVSVDVGAFLDGWHGDNAATFRVGKVSEEADRLLRVTEECLYEAIKTARPGNRIGDISNAIQTYCEGKGFFVVKEYIGHGIGRDLHEAPDIPNFGKAGKGARLTPGMTICIEPMVNQSTSDVKILSDNWTVVEANGNLCAHFEHTIAITEGQPLILTKLN